MATYRRLPSGRWNVQVRRRGHPGFSKTFRTKAAAERWATETENQMERGTFRDLTSAQETTVEDLLDRYEREVTPRKRTQDKERSRLSILVQALGRYTLANLTAEAVIAWADGRLEHVSSDTVRKELNLLAHAIDTGVTVWRIHLHENPATTARKALTGTRTLKAGISRDRRLQPGEFRRLLKASQASHRALWIWFIESAMRRGEVAGMKREHRHGEYLRIPHTKTGRPRTIPMSRHMVRVWRELPLGLRPDSISQAFDRDCARAGIEGLRLHDLRHEATSRLFEKGLEIQEVAAITGHTDWKSLKRYTHPTHQAISRKLLSASRRGK